jgi:hypothetical protein
MLVDEGLDLLVGPLQLENVVVDRACSPLDGGVGAEVEVVLVGLSNFSFDQSTQQSDGVLVTVVLLREEADVGRRVGSSDWCTERVVLETRGHRQ